jgi:isoquinoline 1-oxidoreductase beta subunit
MKLAATAGGGLFLGFHWADSEAATAMEILDEAAVSSGNIGFNSILIDLYG